MTSNALRQDAQTRLNRQTWNRRWVGDLREPLCHSVICNSNKLSLSYISISSLFVEKKF